MVPRFQANQTIAFDLDGVLLDSAEFIESSLRRALEVNGVSIRPGTKVFSLIGEPLPSLIRLVSDSPISSDLLHRCIMTYRKINNTPSQSDLKIYPEVFETLTVCSRSYRLCVLTSKLERSAIQQLQILGLSKFFVTVFGTKSDRAPTSKGQRWIEADLELVRLGYSSISVLIGDRESDVKAAKQNGKLSIGALWGYGSESELERAGPDAIARFPREIPDLLHRLLSSGA